MLELIILGIEIFFTFFIFGSLFFLIYAFSRIINLLIDIREILEYQSSSGDNKENAIE